MMKRILLLILLTVSFAQYNQDARMLGMNGAYTTISNGYRCVGINPANLAIYKKKSIDLFNLSIGLSNNYFSIANYNILNGAHLDDSTRVNYIPKERIMEQFEGRGIRIMQTLNFPLLVNLSIANFAITSRINSNIDMGLPDGFVSFALIGNTFSKDLYFNFEEYIMLSHEIGFSYAKSFPNFSLGVTLKYLLGLFYMGMESMNSAAVKTDPLGFLGNPQYMIQQAIGGGGVGLDIGLTSNQFSNGTRYGFSIINLLGSIKWTQDHFMRSKLEKQIESSMDDFYLRANEYMLIRMQIDSVTLTSMSSSVEDPLIFYDRYKVIPIDNIDGLFMTNEDSLLTIQRDDGTFLYPSGGKYIKKVILSGTDEDEEDEEKLLKDVYEKYSESNGNPFITRQPIFLRMGFSKIWDEGVLFAGDLTTGFSNKYGSSSLWKVSIGSEITKFNNHIFRLGYAFGGLTKKSISFGYGRNIFGIECDFGIALNGGFSLGTTKGLDIAFGILWQPKSLSKF